MVKTKELIICIISIIALVLAITTNVFATDSTYQDIMDAFNKNNNTATDGNNEFSEIPTTTTPSNNSTNNNNTNSNNTNVNNNTTNSMPNTGVSYSSLVIIAIAGVSAVYAYKKIKEYNV